MLIVTIRTDKPEAEIGLYDNDKKMAYKTWMADRQLSVTIHQELIDLLKSKQHTIDKVEGVVCYAGPGSFTGLRIGISVGNAMAYALNIPIIAVSGENWIKQGISRLQQGNSDRVAVPVYGSEAHVTKPRK